MHEPGTFGAPPRIGRRLAGIAVLLGFGLAWPASAAPPSAEDELAWQYAQFVQAFRNQDWHTVCRSVSAKTRTGFGPGDSGCEGVRRVYTDDKRCREQMMLALDQGCRKTPAETGTACTAPPQWHDDEIVYSGARAQFLYQPGADRLTATYLVCGGD